MESKTIIGLVGISAMTALQITAWVCGYNGAVFSFTCGITGAIVGYFFGWERNVQATVKEYLEVKSNGNL